MSPELNSSRAVWRPPSDLSMIIIILLNTWADRQGPSPSFQPVQWAKGYHYNANLYYCLVGRLIFSPLIHHSYFEYHCANGYYSNLIAARLLYSDSR